MNIAKLINDGCELCESEYAFISDPDDKSRAYVMCPNRYCPGSINLKAIIKIDEEKEDDEEKARNEIFE